MDKEKYRKGRDFQKLVDYPDTVSWISSPRKKAHDWMPIEHIMDEKDFKK